MVKNLLIAGALLAAALCSGTALSNDSICPGAKGVELINDFEKGPEVITGKAKDLLVHLKSDPIPQVANITLQLLKGKGCRPDMCVSFVMVTRLSLTGPIAQYELMCAPRRKKV